MSDIMPTATDSSTLSRTIMRYGIAICWLGVSTVISGCSGGYYVDPAAFTAKRPAASQRFDGSERVSAQAVRRRVQPVSARSNSPEITGTTGRGDEVRPWPNRGTPEWDKLKAEDTDRERRIEQLLRTGVCRGC